MLAFSGCNKRHGHPRQEDRQSFRCGVYCCIDVYEKTIWRARCLLGFMPLRELLAAAAVNSLIQTLPAGTAFFIGIVLIVMMTGRLVQTKGSLARAALPFVLQLRWGWHRVERAMERGKFSLDALLDRAYGWCVAHLPVEPVCLGEEQREVVAIDASTIARLRAVKRLALAVK